MPAIHQLDKQDLAQPLILPKVLTPWVLGADKAWSVVHQRSSSTTQRSAGSCPSSHESVYAKLMFLSLVLKHPSEGTQKPCADSRVK